MKIIKSVADLRDERMKQTHKTIGFVPTMGYLHEGHISLLEKAKMECDWVVLSIFVNPLQFGPNEDFTLYPCDEARDLAIAKKIGIDLVFVPGVEEMYPEESLTRVNVRQVTERLCGAKRPGHFDGVATVVTKLFHMVQPDRAYFGMKDVQQVAVITQMVKDLHFPTTIVPCPTIREADGLAKSSRNVYLNQVERVQATILHQSLTEVEQRVRTGALQTASEMVTYVTEKIKSQPLAHIDYVEALTYPRFETFHQWEQEDILLAVAVFFGRTRLIDNHLIRFKGGETYV
ncbi:pantoate--beta-alanine ligase [Hazenella sp. IB182353]|uniref:pantoate--beta-alanine ligase n=1 Tax=Polycladospora coralii TaxID=2771432 RepID=UPI001746EBDF|nr:pantoate--beta-alanine ligase [Polycladospora coralii]MBS7529056.1 pantoate--beta-alanine ligase [Polycladospora coralii]